jgi:hypothetical protein
MNHCPQCRKRFRLTYGAKRRLAVLNLILILGFIVLWFFPDVPRNLLVYMVVALVALALMPTQARYEILSRHYDVPGGPSEAQRARRAPPARKPKSPTRRKA